MNKPNGFSIEQLYENLEKEKLEANKWQPTVPLEILKVVYKYKTENKLTWSQIVIALKNTGLNYTKDQLRHNVTRAKEENLLTPPE